MYQACIFDLDGTLLNTIDAIAYTTNISLEEFGLPAIEREKFKIMVGDGAAKLIERAIEEAGGNPAIFDDLLAAYQRNFSKYSLYRVTPYEGIHDLLTWLKKEGIRIAVLSNKPHARTIENIHEFFGEECFEHIQGEMEEKGIRRKPDPSGVFMVLESLGVCKENCLYIGDTNTDMMTAANAGVDACGVTWGFRPEEELRSYHPAHIAYHPMDIAKIVKEKKM